MEINESFAENWQKARVKGIIISYLRGIKKKSTLNFALKHLKKLPTQQVQEILSEIETGAYLINEERKKKFEELKRIF